MRFWSRDGLHDNLIHLERCLEDVWLLAVHQTFRMRISNLKLELNVVVSLKY